MLLRDDFSIEGQTGTTKSEVIWSCFLRNCFLAVLDLLFVSLFHSTKYGQIAGAWNTPETTKQWPEDFTNWASLAESWRSDLQGQQRNEQSLSEAWDTIHLSVESHINMSADIASVGKRPVYTFVINFQVERKVIATQAWKWDCKLFSIRCATIQIGISRLPRVQLTKWRKQQKDTCTFNSPHLSNWLLCSCRR